MVLLRSSDCMDETKNIFKEYLTKMKSNYVSIKKRRPFHFMPIFASNNYETAIVNQNDIIQL